jgi:hypothetical protein
MGAVREEGQMTPRRAIEDFRSFKWAPRSNGRECDIEVVANGEAGIFCLRQLFSDTTLSTIAGHLGRAPSEEDLEAVLKVRAEELVSNGYLDDLPPSLLRLPAINYQNVPGLLTEAKRKGWIR